MALSGFQKLGIAAAMTATVLGANVSAENDFALAASASAQTASTPSLSEGCFPKSQLQSHIFNNDDQARANAGQAVTGKIAVRDQFYSTNRSGPTEYPVRTTVAADYNGKNYGRYAYTIETSADGRTSCVTNIISADKLQGQSQIPALSTPGNEVVAEGRSINNNNMVISVIMRGEGGNTFNTALSNGQVSAVMSHNRQEPYNFKRLASLRLDNQ